MFGPWLSNNFLSFWFSVWWLINLKIWTKVIHHLMEKCSGGQSLSQLCSINHCVSSPANTETHTAVMSVQNVVFLKAQKLSLLHSCIFSLLWTESVSERINKHDCFAKPPPHTHTRTDLDWVEPSAYWVLGLLHFVAPDMLLLLLSINMPNIFTPRLCHTSLHQLFFLTFYLAVSNQDCLVPIVVASCEAWRNQTVFLLWRNKKT